MKDKIINKAKEMFLRLGFKSITMDDIELPLPGMSGLSSITFTLDGKVRLRPS